MSASDDSYKPCIAILAQLAIEQQLLSSIALIELALACRTAI